MKTKQDDLAQLLAEGIKALGLTMNALAQSQLIEYVALLAKWNKAYNLTAVRDPREMLSRHLLDSLSIAPWVNGQRIADVGSGAGFPGIPLALYFPHKQFVLLDSVGKKTRFLKHVIQALPLSNVEVVQQRVETYQPAACFDNIVARAFSQMANVIQMSHHLCCPGGCFLLMKGVYPEEEIQSLPTQYQLVGAKPLSIPGLQAERHLVIVKERSQNNLAV